METYIRFTDDEIETFEALLDGGFSNPTDALRPIVDAHGHVSSNDVVVALAALDADTRIFKWHPTLARRAQTLLERATDALMPPKDNLHLEKIVRIDTGTAVALRQMTARCKRAKMPGRWLHALHYLADYGVNQNLYGVREAEQALAALIRDESQADVHDLARNALVTIHRAAALVSTPH